MALFVGATVVRIHVRDNPFGRRSSKKLMCVQEGALGVGFSPIRADAAELIALAGVAAGYGAHIRSEGWQLAEAENERIGIARAER